MIANEKYTGGTLLDSAKQEYQYEMEEVSSSNNHRE
jgi:hypothetical protein